jgi:hypothetical protein
MPKKDIRRDIFFSNMKDESILNTIISDKQMKDLASLNVVEAVSALLEQLNKREQDVLKRRFGLFGEPKETLESIGGRHKLTRERIRQIESGGVNKLKKNPELETRLGALRQLVSQLSEEHGGLLEKNYLFKLLANLTQAGAEGPSNIHPYFEFALSRLLNDHFEEVGNSQYFNDFYKIKYQSLEHLEAVAQELLDEVKKFKNLLATAELIALVKGLKSYGAQADKFNVPGNLDLKEVMRPVTGIDTEAAHNDRVIYSLLNALADVEQNKFGAWGHRESREVKPKTINDKIYLVLKANKKPMYYGDIAKKISEMGFDGKTVNTATTHNELILDDKYVLVGRGLYGLREWGYKEGTVADVIAEILKESREPLSKEAITAKVLEQRLVKQTTVNLALMNKNRFERIKDGKYKLKD